MAIFLRAAEACGLLTPPFRPFRRTKFSKEGIVRAGTSPLRLLGTLQTNRSAPRRRCNKNPNAHVSSTNDLVLFVCHTSYLRGLVGCGMPDGQVHRKEASQDGYETHGDRSIRRFSDYCGPPYGVLCVVGRERNGSAPE